MSARYEGESLAAKGNGVRIIPDVHGNFREYRKLVADAARQKLFVVQLGDLVDKGPDSPGVILETKRIVDSGLGVFIRGNHDWKIGRHLRGASVSVFKQQLDTLSQISSHEDSLRVAVAMAELDANAPFYAKFGKAVFSHAAVHSSMFGGELSKSAHDQCLYGTPSKDIGADGLPIRTDEWHAAVPSNTVCFVGHEIRSQSGKPTAVVTESGGIVVYMDCGSGMGGKLVHADFTWGELAKFEKLKDWARSI